MPKAWTFRTETTDFFQEDITDLSLHDFDQQLAVYLDGTGGKYSRDPRTRVCGWAWVQPDIQEEGGILHVVHELGQRGTVPGAQIVPRAEAFALYKFLLFFLGYGQCYNDIHVYTDNQGVYNRFMRGPKTCLLYTSPSPRDS